jgi:pimeloyl-ACP methyl ester carboxylesterase
MVRKARFLSATLVDSACCHLINLVQWRLPDRTNLPVELASYVDRCRPLSREQYYAREPITGLEIEAGLVRWYSPVESEFAENNVARAKIFLSNQGWSAPVVFFLHALMSASDFGYERIAHRFNQKGWNAILLQLPYHFTRVPAGYVNGALALTSELIRNAETMRQAVIEIRQLLELFRNRGADRFGLIATSYGGWIGSILLSLEKDFEFAALLQPLVDIEEAVWNSPASLVIRSRLRRCLIEPGISRQHAHLSSPFDQMPLVDPNRIHLLAGEFDRIVPLKTMQRFAETWNIQNFERVPQGHFGYIAMNRALRRLGLLLALVVPTLLALEFATYKPTATSGKLSCSTGAEPPQMYAAFWSRVICWASASDE